MTRAELIKVVVQEIKGLFKLFDSHDYDNAVNDAIGELEWTLPTTDLFRIQWFKRRAKRHLFYMLWTESAHKFKFEAINLQHRFEHYGKLIDKEDELFKEAQESEPHKFSNVNPAHCFGSKIDAGFAYDDYGRDITYLSRNEVIVKPGDDD